MKNQDHSEDILPVLRSEIDKTIDAYKNIVALRSQKIEQDIEQINVYFKLLENQKDLKLKKGMQKKIAKVLSWQFTEDGKTLKHRQESYEQHFLDLQKSLVSLISKKFQY